MTAGGRFPGHDLPRRCPEGPWSGAPRAGDGSTTCSTLLGGRYLRELGREGQGPGDFRSLGALGWQGDSLWVVDPEQSRVTWYHRGVDLIRVERVEPIQLPAPFYSATLRWVFSDGSFAMEPQLRAEALGTPDAERIPIVRVNPGDEGAEQRVMIRHRGGSQIPLGLGGMMGSARIAQIFRGDTNLFAYHPDGTSVVLVDRPFAATEGLASFRVSVIGVLGDTIRTAEISYTPIQLDPQVAEGMVETEVGALVPEVAHLASDVRETLTPPPAFYPPVTAVGVGHDGRVWLRREFLPDRDTRAWLVLDQGLNPIGATLLPGAVEFRAADDQALWGFVEGDLGVPYLVRYRIQEDR